MSVPQLRARVTGRRPYRPVVLACLVFAALVLPITGEAVACASSHGRLYLAEFTGGPNAGSHFYAAVEGGTATVTIRPTPGDCAWQESSGTYSTSNGSAVSPEDYTAISNGSTGDVCADVHPTIPGQSCSPPQHVTSVQTSEDDDQEAPVESFTFALVSGTMGLADPSSAPIHVIDADEANRATLEPTLTGAPMAYTPTEFGSILIPVFWAGSGPVGSVGYTIAPDPARPAVPGTDFTVASPNPLPINSANRMGFIQIDIVGDKLGEGDESAIITLQPGSGYAVAEPSAISVTIVDNEENVFPRSRFHHPRNRWKYNKADFRIREFHIFATDEGGSGVVAAELALRRNLANGKCAWKAKKGWQKKDCQNREWLPTKYDDVGELFYYRMKQLKSSVGSKIKNYTAFARAIDGAGNVEKEFSKKRNMNTFEIKRRGKTQKR